MSFMTAKFGRWSEILSKRLPLIIFSLNEINKYIVNQAWLLPFDELVQLYMGVGNLSTI